MRTSENGCPVCRRQEAKLTPIASASPQIYTGEMQDRTHNADATEVNCPACGIFVVTEHDFVNLTSPRLRDQWTPFRLSALLRERTTQPLPRFWLQDGMDPYGPLQRTDLTPISLTELVRQWPSTVMHRIERSLCNFARLSETAGQAIKVYPREPSLLFSDNAEEATYLIKALIAYGLLEVGTQTGTTGIASVVVTPRGWAQFEELTRGATAPGNPVFVAMWFGGTDAKPDMDAAFLEAIQPAIVRAGYRVTRVDLAEHNDFIMDKVLGDIRRSPFVVADFTGNRNGVYFEAGFARGLGIPVIHTCRAAHLEEAHFDTKQLNHILWDDPEELRKKLYHRIVGTIGQGPHLPPA
jgi:hypothetical protein